MSVWNKKSLALKTVKKKRGKVLLIHMNDKGLVLKIMIAFIRKSYQSTSKIGKLCDKLMY